MSKNAIKALETLKLNELAKKYPSIPPHARPKPKYSDKNANSLTKCIIDFIQLNGFQAERVNSMGRQVDRRKTVKDVLGRTRTVGSVEWIKGTSTKGTADISATILGISVKIEVKCKATGDNYQSNDQKAYQKKIEQAGGVYLIARDFQGFFNWFNEFVKPR